jgi:phage regulator Rha-like protein
LEGKWTILGINNTDTIKSDIEIALLTYISQTDIDYIEFTEDKVYTINKKGDKIETEDYELSKDGKMLIVIHNNGKKDSMKITEATVNQFTFLSSDRVSLTIKRKK